MSELTKEQLELAKRYLKIFGYFTNTNDESTAIKEFQKFSGLEEDGDLGPKTFRAMGYHRCGCQDIEKMQIEEARIGQKKWTYYIDSFVDGLSKEQQKKIIADSWQNWSNVCDMTAKEIDSKNADVIIGAARGSKNNFDGPNGTLAWAYLSNQSNQQLLMMFDLDETWTISSNQRGILMLNVATHEIGHLLSLTHSKDQTALMAPFYKATVSKPQSDDIQRIQKIYGKPENPPVIPPIEPPVTPPNYDRLLIEIKGNIQSIDIPGYYIRKR